ncbi:MAG: hypothetical protein H8E34_09815 [Bacteroidetes bacterium]|nr:hypothetical protein [Bacteroidota bacterium]MBL6942766.1 hypothetical protein [Bacteroidales bacterium]
MVRINFILIILISGIFLQAQENDAKSYTQDTVWLKTGLAVPCLINEETSDIDFIYVNYKNAVGEIEQSRFPWKQIETAHQNSIPFFLHSSIYRIELNDGTTLTGKLIEERDIEIDIELEDIGQLTIKRAKIKSIIPLDSSKKAGKSLWFNNPHATRLLFAPTAIPLKRGEGYYQNIYIVGNMFNYGVLDNLSFGGGFDFLTMFSTIDDGWHPMLNFNIKSGFQVADNFHAGAGGIYVTIPGEGSAGIIYGLGTVGSYNSNLTLGLGWGFVDGSFEAKPFIMIGGMARMSEKLWFVSENWISPVGDDNYYVVVSYGIRFAAKRIAVDLAFINSKDIVQEIFIGIPFVDFVIKLGK